MTDFKLVMTEYGIEVLRTCIAAGTAFPAAKIAVGDSNGTSYEPTSSQTELVNQLYVGNIYEKGKKSSELYGKYLYFDMQVPASEGDYIIREAALLDADNNFLAVALYPETPKYRASGTQEKVLIIELQILLSENAYNNIIIDDSGTLATKEYIEDNYQALSEKNEANGYAGLNSEKKVPCKLISAAKLACETGEIMTDEEIFNQILNYAHSTFDLSKFTVEGTPTITDDGIASGFSSSNYLLLPYCISDSEKWSINLPFRFNTISTNDQYILCNYASADNYVKINNDNTLTYRIVNEDGTQLFWTKGNNTLLVNTDYLLKFSFNRDKYEAHITNPSTNETFSDLSFSTNKKAKQFDAWLLGVRGVSSAPVPFSDGSIDLKQFSITVDGVPVLSGNQTGIDTIKADDYTVVGSPTISDDGILSVADSSNYIYITNIDLDNKTYKLKLRVKTSSDLTTAHCFTSFRTGFTVDGVVTIRQFRLLQDALKRFTITSFIGSDITVNTPQNVLQPSTWYDIEIEQTTDTLYLRYALAGQEFDEYSTNNSTLFETSSNNFLIGLRADSTSTNLGDGLIDLNYYKIYVDGDLVYQPCLKIPYTLSNANKKVVDTVYRSRVEDMYEQFGYTPYYMSDEYHEVTTYQAVDCIKTNPNGHKFYDISNKPEIDDIYDDTGEAWYYGIDTINERVLLPAPSDINSGKYLYMVVGNSPNWTGVTDVVNQGTTILNQVNEGIVNAIDTRIDLGVTNISSAGKNTVINWLLPDYSNGIHFTSSPYTAPSSGICYVTTGAANATAVIKVNEITVGEVGVHDGNLGSLSILVNKDDVISWTNSYSSAFGDFFPLKGV